MFTDLINQACNHPADGTAKSPMPEDDSAGLSQTNNLLLEQEDLGPPPADTLDFDWRAPSPQHEDFPPPSSPSLLSEQDP
jgi:hypothetical protein